MLVGLWEFEERSNYELARGLVFLMICIFTLPVWFGMTGVWLVAPVTEIAKGICKGRYWVSRNGREIEGESLLYLQECPVPVNQALYSIRLRQNI